MFYTFNLYTTLSSFMINFDELRPASYKLCSRSTRHRKRALTRKLWICYTIRDKLTPPPVWKSKPCSNIDKISCRIHYCTCEIWVCKWHCKMLNCKKDNCMHDPCITWDLSININHRLQILYAVLLSRDYVTTYLRIYFYVLSFLRVTFQ